MGRGEGHEPLQGASFGERLRRCRIEAGLTQEELAERAGLSARGVSDLERGVRRVPYPSTARRLADALGLSGPSPLPLWPAARTLAAPGPAEAPLGPGIPRHFPGHLTSFIGRQQETTEIQRLLATTRLLTLTGAGGVGKTRLALHVADSLPDAYLDGVWFVELAALADGVLVPQSVARALDVRELPGEPLVITLANALRGRHLLLILDNCEHLLPACSDLLSLLLRRCPRLSVLVTSREVLGMGGETVWQVPPLSLPEASGKAPVDEVAASEAAALFVERARAALPGFAVSAQNARAVAEVCRKLDGIPLGLELAAARVRLLSIEQLAERLSDPFRLLSTSDRAAPDRHQTLRATLDWSYGLLSEPEQRLFERLSVFAGGWTLEAAEAVGSGDPVEADQLVNLLGRLVDKSLVVAEPTAEQGPRYRLLETLRQYAEQRLADRDEQQVVQQRHAHYFLPLYERAELELLTGADRVWLDRLEREHDNLRAALRFLIARADVDGALRLAGTARRFWWMRGYFTEGRGYLEQALALDARAGTGVPRLAARAKVQFGLGNLALAQGDLDAAREGLRASVDLYRELADWGGAAWALCVLGEEAVYRAEYTQARGLFQQAVAAGRASGQRAITAISLAWGAWPGVPGLAWPGATHEAARLGEIGETAQEALRVCRAIGFRPGVCVALLVLGEVRHQQGDTAAARALWDQSLAAAREVGFKHYVVPALINLARMAKDRGDTREAGRLLAESLRLSRELGDRLAIAGCLEALVELAGRRFDRAVCMAGAAATLRQSVGAPVSPTERVRVASRLDALRRCLGAATFESYWLEGCTAPADHIIRSALQLIEELSIVQPNSPPGGEATHAAAGLTRRERQVAALIARGQTNRQIAERLTIAEGTAGNHVQSILDKLGFHTRAQIASWATAHGLSTTPAE